MHDLHTWESPSSRLLLNAVLDTLADLGYDGLTVLEVQARAGVPGRALDHSLDLDALVIAALEPIRLFPVPEPTGELRTDLRRLLAAWRSTPTRDERVVAAVLSAALWRPRLDVAVHESLDRPLAHTLASIVTRSPTQEQLSPQLVQTLCWILRGLWVDRLRSGARLPVDIDLLVDFLLAGLRAASGLEALGSPPVPATSQGTPTRR
jgi:AcrR family transcriptional regulator